MKKQFIASLCILAVVGVAVGVGVQGADTDTIGATVTAQLISVSVSDGSVDYGVLPVNTNADTVNLVQTQVVTNNSNVAVDLEVISSDAVGVTDWDLVASTGTLDEFTHEFSSNDGSSYATFNIDNVTYASLATSVAVSGTQNLDLRIKTPASVSDNTQKTITVTVLATKS